MSIKDFINVKIIAKGKEQNVKIEKGCSFENNGAIYHVDNNGKLNVFDKESQKWSESDSIKMTGYQFSVFQSVADNVKEKHKKKPMGNVVLSKKDIDKSMEQYKNKTLNEDLSKNLPIGYKIENGSEIIYSKYNTVSAYVDSGNPSTSGTVLIGYGTKKDAQIMSEIVNKKSVKSEKTKPSNVKPDSALQKTTHPSKPEPLQSSLMTENLFSGNSNVICEKGYVYTVKEGDTFLNITKANNLDTYPIIKANPQLKEGIDYKVTYSPKGELAKLDLKIVPGQKLNIPSRYKVKPGSVRTLSDVTKVTGVSQEFLNDFLTVIETHPKHPGQPDLKTYDDGFGTPTIGYGHTGKVRGKALSLRNPINITPAEACELLANDILEHKARVMSYLGKENYLKAPQSVQNTIMDISYNKGIWDGFLTPYFNKYTKQVKKDLENKHYSSALAHTTRESFSTNLEERNIYRVISGMQDLSINDRKKVMAAVEPYYKKVCKDLRARHAKRKKKNPKIGDKNWELTFLHEAWNNAKGNKISGYRMKLNQKK